MGRLGNRPKARVRADHRSPQASRREDRGSERAGAWDGGDQCGWVQGGDGDDPDKPLHAGA
jgi:hypothetical protein